MSEQGHYRFVGSLMQSFTSAMFFSRVSVKEGGRCCLALLGVSLCICREGAGQLVVQSLLLSHPVKESTGTSEEPAYVICFKNPLDR